MTCFHCGEPFLDPEETYQVQLPTKTVFLCCTGCEAITQSIVDNGLLSYYTHRTGTATKQNTVPDELALSWYDNAEIEDDFIRIKETEKEVTLAVDNLVCSACAWLIESHLFKHIGVTFFRVNATTHRATLRWDPKQTKLSDVLYSLHCLGYPSSPFEWDKYEKQHQQNIKKSLYRLGVAGIASMQVMMIAIALYFEWFGDLDPLFKQYLRIVSAIFSVPVLTYSAWPFYQSAYRSLRLRVLNMDVPVSLALILAFSASLYATYTQQGEVFFESITMFTFFLLCGRFGELKARYKASAFSANLYKATPSIATLVSGEQVATKSLSIGDVIFVRAGDVIPMDGILLKGETVCDESMLTGESTGVKKNIGESVFAGSINTKECIELKVTTEPQNTWLSHILKWQEEAQNAKPKVMALTDSISHYFILIILVLSVLTALIWWNISPDEALWITISVLVATCPCALSLATPTAFTCATAKLSKLGVLIKQAHVWDTLAKVDHCVLDKTGTLTYGKIQIESHQHFNRKWSLDEVYAITFALEQNINHPIAKAFQDLPQTKKVNIENIKSFESQGVSGWWQSQEWRLGNATFVGRPKNEGSGIWLTCDGDPVMRFALTDCFRPHTNAFVNAMKQRQWKHTVLTGDPSESAIATLSDFGFLSVKTGLFPQEKLEWVNRFAEKDIVMMIGDGINDAPVLAGAHVSIALNQGTDLAKSSADAILLGDSLMPILTACDLAKRCQRIVKQNFAWALGYNLCILPLAMMGMVPPYLAVLGMSFSSLLVVSNSLRLLK